MYKMSAGYAAPFPNPPPGISDADTVSQLLTMYGNAMTANRQLVEMLEKSRAEVSSLRRARSAYGSVNPHAGAPAVFGMPNLPPTAMISPFVMPGGGGNATPHAGPAVPFAGAVAVAPADGAARMTS